MSPEEEITLIVHMPSMMGPQHISKGKRSLLLLGRDLDRMLRDAGGMWSQGSGDCEKGGH